MNNLASEKSSNETPISSHLGLEPSLPFNSEGTLEETPTPSHFEPEASVPRPKATSNPTKASISPRHTIRYWIACCVTVLILVPVFVGILSSQFQTQDFFYNNTISEEDTNQFQGRALILEVILQSADPVASSITFDWVILGENPTSPCYSGAADLSTCTDINIYFDENSLVSNNKNNLRTNSAPKPLFRYNAFAVATGDFHVNNLLFRTDHILVSNIPGARRNSLISYPFDQYQAGIHFYAQENATGSDISLLIIGVTGNALGFKTSANDVSGYIGPAFPEDLYIALYLKRGLLVRAFCILVAIAIWLITLVLFLMTLTSVIFGFRQKVELLVVPVATIFTFTQLRSSMPGAPTGFGDVLDFFGTLPCLAILAFSAVLSIGSFILSDPTVKKREMNAKFIRGEVLPALRIPLGKLYRATKKGLCRLWRAVDLERITLLGRISRKTSKAEHEDAELGLVAP